MAGYMYLGSQRVCPAILVGGGQPEAPQYFTMVMPETLDFFIDGLEWTKIYDRSYNDIPVKIDFSLCKTVGNENSYLSALSGFAYNGKNLIIDFSGIEKITRYAFNMAFNKATLNSEHLELNFENLKVVGNSGCMAMLQSTNVTVVRFPKLDTIGGSAFISFCSGSNGDIYFNAVKPSTFTSGDELDEICSSCDGRTLHFPSNLSSTIPNQDDYPSFSGSNTTILYDLPTTE